MTLSVLLRLFVLPVSVFFSFSVFAELDCFLCNGSEDSYYPKYDMAFDDPLCRIMAFNSDGKMLFTGGQGGSLNVYQWNEETSVYDSKSIRQKAEEDNNVDVVSLAVSESGNRLIAGFSNSVVEIWDYNDKKCVAKIKDSVDTVGSYLPVFVDCRGDKIVLGYDRGDIRLYSITAQIDAFSKQYDKQYEVEGSAGRCVKLYWKGTCFNSPDESRDIRMTSLSLSHDGNRCISGHDDGTFFLWSLPSDLSDTQDNEPCTITAKEIMSYHPLGHLPASSSRLSVGFLSGGHAVTLGDFDRGMKVWHLDEFDSLGNKHAEFTSIPSFPRRPSASRLTPSQKLPVWQSVPVVTILALQSRKKVKSRSSIKREA